MLLGSLTKKSVGFQVSKLKSCIFLFLFIFPEGILVAFFSRTPFTNQQQGDHTHLLRNQRPRRLLCKFYSYPCPAIRFPSSAANLADTRTNWLRRHRSLTFLLPWKTNGGLHGSCHVVFYTWWIATPTDGFSEAPSSHPVAHNSKIQTR